MNLPRAIKVFRKSQIDNKVIKYLYRIVYFLTSTDLRDHTVYEDKRVGPHLRGDYWKDDETETGWRPREVLTEKTDEFISSLEQEIANGIDVTYEVVYSDDDDDV